METKTLHEQLAVIQQTLKVSKSQKNTFGNYNYRSCEDILEAVKPLLNGLTLVIEDEVINIGARYYVKATASLNNGTEMIDAAAYAREAEDKKGMDDAQITGAASSYARKYALNGLFAIDDTKDADTMDNTAKPKETKVEKDVDPDWIKNTPINAKPGRRYCANHPTARWGIKDDGTYFDRCMQGNLKNEPCEVGK